MNDVTVLYYSASTEDPKFEANIRKNLLANMGDLPLISVTQEPVSDFGQNICVGKQVNCYGNEYRQIQLGLREVKTKYVITAEADFLYPPEYFQFQPGDADYYRFNNVWVYYVRRERSWNAWAQKTAYFKRNSDGAQIIKKDFWLDAIKKDIGEEEKWYTEENKASFIKHTHMGTDQNNTWTSENPVITFKTYDGVRRKTHIECKVIMEDTFPYWGDMGELKNKMFS